jgi:hypothetical protein
MVASLMNLTVPLSTTGQSPTQGLLMPKLKFRFRAVFENFGIGNRTELTKQVIDIARPSVNFNPITLDVYNSKMYIAGKPEWQEMTCTLRDDASGQVTGLIGSQVQKQFDFYNQASAVSGVDYKFNLTFEALDGGNGATTVAVIERWNVVGCMISSVNYNDFNYATNDAATISLTIRFDNAAQDIIGQQQGGVGIWSGSRTAGTLATGGVASGARTGPQ